MLALIRDAVLILVLALAIVWHFRDSAAVRNQRHSLETGLQLVGVQLETVRRYWPLEGKGEDVLKSASEVIAPYNPIEGARKTAEAANEAQRKREDALENATKD